MSLCNNFIDIDIGKFNFVVATHGTKNTEYENKSSGIRTFIKEFRKELVSSLCILETTGGYETELLLTLCNKNFAMHRANMQS